jgi:hypothetical protein
MTQDQVFVPRTRSQRGLPPLNSDGESLVGASISNKIMKELHEAIGDSPIGAGFGAGSYLVWRCERCELFRDRLKWNPFQLVGWPMYIIRNAAGQRRYPSGSNRTFLDMVIFAYNTALQTSTPTPWCSHPISLVRSFFQTLASFYGLALLRPGYTNPDFHKLSACTLCPISGKSFTWFSIFTFTEYVCTGWTIG